MKKTDALLALEKINAQLLKVKKELDMPNDETLTQLQKLLLDFEQNTDSAILDTQQWLAKIFNFYPQLAPIIPRALLWFIGGECLHYLTDEELLSFEQTQDNNS